MIGGVLPTVSDYEQSIARRISNAIRESKDYQMLEATVDYGGGSSKFLSPGHVIADFIAEGHDAGRVSITLTWKEEPEKVWELRAIDYTEYFKTWEDLQAYIGKGRVLGGSQPYTISMVDPPEGATVNGS